MSKKVLLAAVMLVALPVLAQDSSSPETCPTPTNPTDVPLPPGVVPDKPATPTETKHNADPTSYAVPPRTGVVSPPRSGAQRLPQKVAGPKIDATPMIRTLERTPAAKESRSRREGTGRGKR